MADSIATPEEWRAIPGYEGIYEVSSLGRVRSLGRTVAFRGYDRRVRERILRATPDGRGYQQVSLFRDGRSQRRKVHQLVAHVFLGPRPDGMETCHTNDIRTDNRASNLRYDSHAENAADHVIAGNHYLTKRQTCPRGHILAEPNLCSWKFSRGHRVCLACSRARAWVSVDKITREPLFREIADQKFRSIMESA